MAGAPTRRAQPRPGLPDLAVVVYAHTGPTPTPPPARRRRRHPGGSATVDPSWSPRQHADAVDRRPRRDRPRRRLPGQPRRPRRRPVHRRPPARPGPARPRYPAPATAASCTGAGWAIGCASPETLIEVDRRPADHPPDQGHPPGHRRRPRRTARLRQGTRRTHHDRRPGTQRPGPRRRAPAPSRVDELFAVRRWCDLWQAESTISRRPPPTASAWPTCCARSAPAGRSPAHPNWPP